MTTTPPEETAPQRAAGEATGESSETAARAKVLGWARRTIDLIPTSWMITGAGAVILATTAAFGGLATAAVDPIPQLAVGETFTGSDLEMTVLGAELRDDPGALAVFPDEERGERVLLVEVEVVNTFPTPRSASSLSTPSPVVNGIRVEGIDTQGDVAHADDFHLYPTLQPDVPTRVLLAWVVGSADLRDGDEIALTLPDSTHFVGTSVVRGDYWDDVQVGATMTLTVHEAVEQ